MILVQSAILFAAILISCDANLSMKDTTEKDFVNSLKLKLRKNNDDYVEMLLETTTEATQKTTMTPYDEGSTPDMAPYSKKNVSDTDLLLFNKDPPNPNIKIVDLRRSFSKQEEDNIEKSIPRNNLTIDVPGTSTQNELKQSLKLEITTSEPRPYIRSNQMNTDTNQEKMEKFKKFMVKNKDFLNDYLNNKLTGYTAESTRWRVTPTMTTMTTMTSEEVTQAALTQEQTSRELQQPNLRALKRKPLPTIDVIQFTARVIQPETTTTASTTESTTTLSTKRVKKHHKAARTLMRANMVLEQNPRIPSHGELDMAPAKGSRINVLRLKGRLCQRNVMIPEGPKYDSKGRMYLGGYGDTHGRDYAKTKRPSIVLPRCCNCCKKSVLGCE